jgi:hypothetical protein
MSQFAVMHLNPRLKILEKLDAWHWKMPSSLRESFNKTLKSRKLNLQGAQVRTDPTNIVGLPPKKA